MLRFHRRVILKVALFWQTRWGERSFLVTLSILIGAVAAVAAAGLHMLVTKFEEFGIWLTEPHAFQEYIYLTLLLCLPMLGLCASFIIQRVLGGPRYAKSLSPLILSLSRKRTNIPALEMISHMLSSAFSVGFGGSAGLEAPSVLTGAAIGANGAGFFRVNRVRRNLLIGCGAAAAISAIFDSPIAGVLFAAEVLLPEISVSALVPMVMSSAVAAVISRMISQGNHFEFVTEPWRTDSVPSYFILGLISALVGVYVIRCAYFTADKLKSRFRSPYQRLFVGGGLLCVLLFLFPTLRGQGYLYIEKLFKGNLSEIANNSPLLSQLPSETLILVIVFIAVLLFKVVVSVLTVDSGGDGGIFAPSMFIGAFTGFGFARLVNLTGIVELQECNFVAVGMCGVFTAVMRAPLTGIFLIAEVTGGYILLVPLMIVSAVSYLLARIFEPNSIYRKALVENNLLDDDRDRTMLRSLPVRLCLNRNYHVLKVDQSLERLVNLVEGTPEEIFPVLDDDGKLLGVVHLEKVLSVMLNPQTYGLLLVMDLMESPVGTVTPDDDLAYAMANFEKFNLNYLPVCDSSGIFHGFIAKAPIFAKYRKMVNEANAF
jgi:CIC family chloride channel protein